MYLYLFIAVLAFSLYLDALALCNLVQPCIVTDLSPQLLRDPGPYVPWCMSQDLSIMVQKIR